MSNQKVNNAPLIVWVSDTFRRAFDKCFRIERLLSLYVDNEMSDARKLEVDSHLSQCPACKASLAVMQATHQVLSQRQPVQPPSYLSERLRQAIAIDSSRPVQQLPSQKWTLGRTAGRLAIAGFGAIAVLVAVTVFEENDRLEPIRPKVATVMPKSVPNTNAEIASSPHPSSMGLRHLPLKPRTSSFNIASTNGLKTEMEPITTSTASLPLVRNPIEVHRDLSQRSRAPSPLLNSMQGPSEIASRLPAIVGEQSPVIQDQGATNRPGGLPMPIVITPGSESAIQANDGQSTSTVENTEDSGDQTPHISLVDEELRSMAAKSYDDQPKLVRLAINQTRLVDTSPGVQIVGSEIDRPAPSGDTNK